MVNETVVQGMVVDGARLEWLQGWASERRDWSRKRLAQELCRCWEWRNAQGRLKDFAARSFLLKAELKGWIELPPLQEKQRRARPVVAGWSGWEEPPPREGTLREWGPVRLETVSAGTPAAQRWAFLLEKYHYLKFRVVGENLGYLAYDRHGREIACLLFGAAAWRCRVRDAFLALQGAKPPLAQIANNTRFLILPWVRVPHLASHLLGRVAARIRSDWQAKYGHGLQWLESFVDTGLYRGTCYRAANWIHVGETTGRSRQDREHRLSVPRKAVYLYRLRP